MRNKRNNKKTNSIKSSKSSRINFDRSQEADIEVNYELFKQLKEENKELKDIISSKSILQSADKVKDLKFKIFKERFDELMEVISKSKEFITIVFHGLDIVGSIQSDNAKEKNQDNDISFPNSSSNTDIRSNDSDTL